MKGKNKTQRKEPRSNSYNGSRENNRLKGIKKALQEEQLVSNRLVILNSSLQDRIIALETLLNHHRIPIPPIEAPRTRMF